MDMLTALRVVARNFSEETLQGAYEIIQHQNAALPSEMFAAAVYLQAGRTPAEVSGLAREGRLMGFFGPERPEEPSRIAACTMVEAGREQRFYTMDFGRFNPQTCLEDGHRIWTESRHIRNPGHGLPHPGSTRVCRKTRRAPLYPAWLGLRAHRGPVPAPGGLPRRGRPYHLQRGSGHRGGGLSPAVAGAEPEPGLYATADVKTAGYYGHTVVCCVLAKGGNP
ncbi:MAG: hypothetical protein ACLRNQ_06190 [Flavonifractor plautii]